MIFDFQKVLDKYYLPGTQVREILLQHSRSVADLALEIARIHKLPLDPADIEAAAMLHDIGICRTDALGIDCHGSEQYIRHGILGADMLRADGAPESIARVAERHTGAGIYSTDISELSLPLPLDRILYPETLLERLVCYADKFYSKSGDMQRKSLDRVRASMLRHSPAILDRFERLHTEFSI